MTYEQYWYGDPMMVRAYYKADKIRQQRINEEAWLNGAYVYKALDATVGNAFRQKGSKQEEYPSKPYEFEVKEETEVEKEQREDAEVLYAQAYMMNMVMAGRNWKK